MKRTAFRFKTHRLVLPRVRLRNGFIAPKDYVLVRIHENVALPWRDLKPMIRCAATHVKREAARVWRDDYVRRAVNHPVLEISMGRQWRGMATGARAEVFIGKLTSHPQRGRYRKFKDMPEYWYRDWAEHFVGLTSHELWHRWDGLPSGKKAEFDTELVTMDAIDAWRKKKGYVYNGPEAAIITEPTCNGEIKCEHQTVDK